jgi:hypothetical protein
MICLKGTKIIDRKSNAGHMDRCTYRYGKKKRRLAAGT